MALRRPHPSSSLTFCFLLALSIVFLAPHYHSHDHAADHHHEHGDDHLLLHDGAGHEGLSASQHSKSVHLHIKKDICITDRHRSFKSSLLRSGLFAEAETPVYTEQSLCRAAGCTLMLVFHSNSRDCLSGLSPPAA
jgi:hypothetical protein